MRFLARDKLLTLSTSVWARATAHLSLARISNAPTVVSNVLAGVALASVIAPVTVGGTALLAVAMVLYYTAGMYLNDLFDSGLSTAVSDPSVRYRRAA